MFARRLVSITLCGLLASTLAAGVARAQFPGRGGFRLPPGAEGIMLLAGEEVQKELGMSAEQVAGAQKMADDMRADIQEMLSGLQDLSPEERREQMAEIQEEMAEKMKSLQKIVDGLLDAKQKDRLKQLALQRAGVGAFENSEVVAALALSDEQQQKLSAIREEGQRQMRDLFPRGGGGGGGGGGEDREARREKMAKLQKDQNDKAMEVLTAAQREKLEQMKGKKFDFPAGGRRGLFGG